MCGLSWEEKAKQKYQIIDIVKSKYTISSLCATLGCSKSGYYDWIAHDRPLVKAFDKKINDLVVETYEKNPTKGIRRIRMSLKKTINLKNSTIYRYMKLNGIQSTTRRKRHKYPKTEHHSIPNLIKRNFRAQRPNQKWSIDISYIFATDGLKYLCAIKDMYDKSIVSHTISNRIDMPLVLNTVSKAILLLTDKEKKELILHSDQGCHFVSIAYQNFLKQNNINQSISAKGSCADNMPIESFFSILKTECIYQIHDLKCKDIENIINNFIHYYNNERQQEKIGELAPIEFRNQTLQSLFI